jgi:hypothetical protein
MQADLGLRAALTEGLSFAGVVGYRGQARAADEPVGAGAARPVSGSRFISREHYFMYRPQVLGWYVRLGRFFAPYGLRLAEHYTYVRRDTGFNLLEESYNASFGVVKNTWEIHATVFGPDFLRDTGARDKGLAGMVEWRVGDASALGLGTRIGLGEDITRGMGGAFAKTYFETPKLLLQGELDVIHNTFGSGLTTNELVAFAGITWFPVRGLWLMPFYERRQTDLRYKNTGTDAGGFQLSWFPYPHVEVVWLGRGQMASGQQAARTGMLFVHYYM